MPKTQIFQVFNYTRIFFLGLFYQEPFSGVTANLILNTNDGVNWKVTFHWMVIQPLATLQLLNFSDQPETHTLTHT